MDFSDNNEEEEEGWAYLPDFLLERIFSLLPIKNLSRCTQVCWNWNRIVLTCNSVWDNFIFENYLFTKRKFTIHAGWQYMIDHFRLRFLISRKVNKWRHIKIKPMDISNLYEFLRVLTNFTEYYEKNQDKRPLKNIRSFEFDWQMHFYEESGTSAVGTGGEILGIINLVCSHLFGLRFLALRQFQLDVKEADCFMDDLLQYFAQTLHCLTILNLTKHPHSFLHFGLFLNLRKLVVSPQHLNNDVLYLIASNTNMRHLVIIQDEKTIGTVACDERAWKEFKRLSPNLQVHLRVRGRCTNDLVYQPCAPVVSLVYDSPFSCLTPQNALTIVENYSESLKLFIQRNLARRYRSNAFDDRADTSAVMLARHCNKLQVLAIRERMSTATALLIAHLCGYRGNEFHLCIRRNAVLKRADWPYNQGEWSKTFYRWLRTTARSYEATEFEIGRLFGRPFHFLTDNEYMYAL